MNPATFLQECDQIVTGRGFKKVLPGLTIHSLTEADGDKLDNASTPAMATLETNHLGVQVASSATLIGLLQLVVPEDYDQSKDYFRIRVLAVSAGDTDTPAIDATIYQKRAGSDLSSDLDPTISAAINNNTTGAGWVEINADGLGLQGGDSLAITLSTGEHTTDATNIYALEVVYKSDLVYFTHSDR